MIDRRIRPICCLLLTLLVLMPLGDTVFAQRLRRPFRRPARTPVVRGDGRLLERARDIVNLFTESGTELRPVATVSLASFEQFQHVARTVARQIRLERGSTEEPAVLEAFLAVYEGIVARGFDTRQPIGLILQTDGILFYPLLFTSLHLDGDFGRRLQQDYVEQLPDGRSVLRRDVFRWPLGPLFVQRHNGWVFIATEAQLDALPDDPTVLLRGLDREHLFAARFDLRNMPKLSTRALLSFGEMSAVAQAETELDKAAVRLGIGHLRSLAEQTDLLEYTLSYDEANNDYVFRQREDIRPNTERARLFQERRDAVSPFHGFYRPEGAVLASHLVMPLTASQREQLEIILDETVGRHLLTEEERAELRERPASDPAPAASKPSRRRIGTRIDSFAAANTPDPVSAARPAAAPAPVSEPSEPVDPRDRLAALLSRVPPEQLEEIVSPKPETPETTGESRPEPIPDLVFRALPAGTWTDAQKLEIVLRRIGACYYWALLGAVRGGYFDGATTCSRDCGVLGAYNIVEGRRFREAFDAVFAEVAEKFPEVHARNIRKDYAESEGFLLTELVLRPADFIGDAFWMRWIPSPWLDRETRLVLGVRDDAICFAVGQGDLPESRLLEAIAGTGRPQPVDELFFLFSAYELGQTLAASGDPDRFVPLKTVAAQASPNARAYAVSEFADNSKTITFRVGGLLTPSLWRFRENLHDMRSR